MCDTCQWEALLSYIEAMCATGAYGFADTTLSGIYDRVKLNKHATDRQKKAVDNIRKSKRPRRR